MERFFVCRDPELDLPEIDDDRIQIEEFSGPHPAGLVGTHIHFLDPCPPQQNGLAHRPTGRHSLGTSVHNRADNDRTHSRSGRPHRATPQTDPHPSGSFNNGPRRRRTRKRRKSGHPAALSSPDAKQTKSAPFWDGITSKLPHLKKATNAPFWGWLTPGFEFFTIKNLALSKMFFGQRLKLEHLHQWQPSRTRAARQLRRRHAAGHLAQLLDSRTRHPRPRRRRKTRHTGTGRRRPMHYAHSRVHQKWILDLSCAKTSPKLKRKDS